jgi:ABC-type iron transport system FetAB permease component
MKELTIVFNLLVLIWKHRDAVFCIAMAAILAVSSYLISGGYIEFNQFNEDTSRIFILVWLSMFCSAAALLAMACHMHNKAKKLPMATKNIDHWA